MNIVRPIAVGWCRGVLGRKDFRIAHRLDHVGDRLSELSEWRDCARALVRIARITQQNQHHQLPVVRRGHEGHWRRRHDVDDRRQFVRGGLGRFHHPDDDVGCSWQDENTADNPIDGMKPVQEACHDAKVPATTSNRPEQIWIRQSVYVQQLAVGGHELGCQHTVDGEAVLARQVSNPAGKRDAAYSHRPGITESGRQAILPTAVEYSPADKPVSAHALRRWVSTLNARMSRRSTTIPPSVVPWPAPL